MIPAILSGKTNAKKAQDITLKPLLFPSIQELIEICRTFLLIDLAWIFFRAETWRDAFSFLAKICSPSSFFTPLSDDIVLPGADAIIGIGILLMIEWVQRTKTHPLHIRRLPILVRWGIYLLLSLAIFNFTVKKQIPFLYFQF